MLRSSASGNRSAIAVREIAARAHARDRRRRARSNSSSSCVERELGVGEQHRELRPGQRLRAPAALGELDLVGQELDRAVELAAGLQDVHQPLLEAEVLEPAPLGERERQRSAGSCCAARAAATSSVISASSALRASSVEPAVAHRRRQRDLDVDLEVGGVDAGRIVDGVGVEPHAAHRRLDAAALGHAEIGALADHFARSSAPVMRIASLARSPTASSVSVDGAHIGADAAEDRADRPAP